MKEIILEMLKSNSFLLFIIWCGIYYICKYVFYRLPYRFLRHLDISKNGWPPNHLDSDGDFKKE